MVIYVDDGLALFPREVCPILSAALLLFLVALGVPLSWEKVHMGDLQPWIGWSFNWKRGLAELPDNKRQTLMVALSELTVPGRKVARKNVERCVGLLVWFCGGAFWLKPWLQCLYHLLFKPVCVSRSLSSGQFGILLQALTAKLCVSHDLHDCDVLSGWKLHSVWNCPINSLDCEPLRTPSCVFYDYSSPRVQCNKESAWAAQFFLRSVESQLRIPLRIFEPERVHCAADAFASGQQAGVGGWWTASDEALQQSQVFWFSEMLDESCMPPWMCAKETFQQDIASFEGIAQLCLLVGRTAGQVPPSGVTLRFHQLCDNMGTAASLRKKLSMQVPLSYVVQAVGFSLLSTRHLPRSSARGWDSEPVGRQSESELPRRL